MPVTTDIVQSWRRPRAVMRRHLAMGEREDRAIMFLMLACGLIALAQLPRLAREAFQAGEILQRAPAISPVARFWVDTFEDSNMERLVTYTLLAWIMMAPLIFYGLAWLCYAVLKLIGLPITPYDARLSLFWALLASIPAALLYGLSAGFVGPSPGTTLSGALWLGGFAVIWVFCLYEVTRRDSA